MGPGSPEIRPAHEPTTRSSVSPAIPTEESRTRGLVTERAS